MALMLDQMTLAAPPAAVLLVLAAVFYVGARARSPGAPSRRKRKVKLRLALVH